MKNRKIGVITDDEKLFRKIRLLMLGECQVEMASLPQTDFDLTVYDCEALGVPPDSCIKVTRHPEKNPDAIPLPFSLPYMKKILSGGEGNGEKKTLRLDSDGKLAYLDGVRVKLTDVEFRLLTTLYDRRGFVSREELRDTVWGADTAVGVVNVYIHYLRTKLEKNGEKIIICSRGGGYKIDERFLGEGYADTY